MGIGSLRTFQITREPQTEAPAWVNRAWVGVELPFSCFGIDAGPEIRLFSRKPAAFYGDGYAADAVTAIAILSQHGEAGRRAAAWYSEHVGHIAECLLSFPYLHCKRMQEGDSWMIQLKDGHWTPDGYICNGCLASNPDEHRCHEHGDIPCACLECDLARTFRAQVCSPDEVDILTADDLATPCCLSDLGEDGSLIFVETDDDLRAAVCQMFDDGATDVAIHNLTAPPIAA